MPPPLRTNKATHHVLCLRTSISLAPLFLTHQVVLTGHSLGGGVSKIAATRAGVPVFAISAPGISLSHRIFGVKREVIDELEINLLSVRCWSCGV
jgi:putative lipase involved disintegration of autophagic bodies